VGNYTSGNMGKLQYFYQCINSINWLNLLKISFLTSSIYSSGPFSCSTIKQPGLVFFSRYSGEVSPETPQLSPSPYLSLLRERIRGMV